MDAVDPHRLDAAPDAAGAIASPLAGATIVVVDDLREIRFIAEHMIRRAGGQSLSAADGDQAVDLLAQYQADGRKLMRC